MLMDPATLTAPIANTEYSPDARRVSPDPQDGYVLNPWSGLYQETEATYQHRLKAMPALSV
ncbi:hypothetical protein [Dyella solisilvae]|uniref:hypothetical protein n=1 Tax=Dyella solisilvae TaxID=1920168 RepID=UPI0011C07153|nr:hypothetical protein [Dyella solisilvae]